MTQKIVIVQGAQYGSESKGAVSHFLCRQEKVEWTVRTGSINAGHTIYHDGKKMVFQQLPVGSVYKGVKSVIGPGAYVHAPTLNAEIEQAKCQGRLFLDLNCGVHLDSYTDEAKEAGRSLKIGATGKGCAEAIVHKIKDRGVGDRPLLFRNYYEAPTSDWKFADTAMLLNSAYQANQKILIEGTQGTHLDLHTGPYPFTTSRQTTAAAWVAEAGLSPALDYEVVLVARTFPIRVAGNSGPMEEEIDWIVLATMMNCRMKLLGLPPVVKKEVVDRFQDYLALARRNLEDRGASPSQVALESATLALQMLPDHDLTEIKKLFETTTVTKRLRRVAELDVEQLRDTCIKEAASYVVLTFLNYVYPELAPQHNPERKLHDDAKRYVEKLQHRIDRWIKYVSIGPLPEDIVPSSTHSAYR